MLLGKLKQLLRGCGGPLERTLLKATEQGSGRDRMGPGKVSESHNSKRTLSVDFIIGTPAGVQHTAYPALLENQVCQDHFTSNKLPPPILTPDMNELKGPRGGATLTLDQRPTPHSSPSRRLILLNLLFPQSLSQLQRL